MSFIVKDQFRVGISVVGYQYDDASLMTIELKEYTGWLQGCAAGD